MRHHPLYEQIVAVAKAVQASEAEADRSIISTARLIETTITAHQHPDVHASMVQPALAKLQEALALSIDARAAIVSFHKEVGRSAERLGADPSTWGDWWPCPSGEIAPAPANVQPLRAA